MTIKHKLLGNALFTSMLMLGILGTLAWSFGSLQKGLGQIVENSRVGSEMSQKTETTLDRASSDLAAASADLAEVAKEIAVTNQAIRINQRKIADISGTLADFSESINGVVDDLPDGDTRWELEDLADELVDIQDILRKEALVGLTESAKAMEEFTLRINNTAQTSEQLVAGLQIGTENSRLSNREVGEIASLSSSFRRSFAAKQKLLVAMILAAVVFSILMGILILRALVSPLEKAVGIAEGIAEGNLDQTVDLDGKDEIGQLGRAMDKMVQELLANRSRLEEHARNQQDLIDQVTKASREIATGAAMVANSSSGLSRGAMNQASSLEEINSSMDLISEQIRTTAEDAAKANALAADTQRAAQNGANQTAELTRAMTDIQDSSEQISRIIKTIDDIAFQTNLLALNAAVEAARAGSHGKGFAVVAEEVRSLAGRSAKAARETTHLIEESVSRADRGKQSVENSNAALGEIADLANQTLDLVAAIASTANEQATGIDEIRQALGQIGSVVQETAANSEETASASDVLSSQSGQLRELLEKSASELAAGKDETGGGGDQGPPRDEDRTEPSPETELALV